MQNLLSLYFSGIKSQKINWLAFFTMVLMCIVLVLMVSKEQISLGILALCLTPFILLSALYTFINYKVGKEIKENVRNNNLVNGYLWFTSHSFYFSKKSEFAKELSESLIFPVLSLIFYDSIKVFPVAYLIFIVNIIVFLLIFKAGSRALKLLTMPAGKTPYDYYNLTIEDAEQKKKDFEEFISEQNIKIVNREKGELMSNTKISAGSQKKTGRL